MAIKISSDKIHKRQLYYKEMNDLIHNCSQWEAIDNGFQNMRHYQPRKHNELLSNRIEI